MHHPGAVSVVPVRRRRPTVLLVRQYRAAVDRELLEIPAGKRDVDGEAPRSPRPGSWRRRSACGPAGCELLAEFYNSPGFCDEHSFVFLALDLEPCATSAQGVEEQHMTIERVALADVPGLIAAGDVVDAKSIIGLFLAREALGTGTG